MGLILVLALSVFSGCGKKSGSSKAVATYKGGEITQAEFDKFIGVNKAMDPSMASMLEEPTYKDYVLNQMLNQQAILKILYSKATDQSKKDAEKKADDYMAPIKSFDKDQKAQFESNLKTANVTEKDLKDYFKQTFAVMTDMSNKVTDDQVKAEYDKALKEDPHYYDMVNVRHILIATMDPSDQTGQKQLRTKEEALKRAKEVKDKLAKGGDYDALAKEYSDDPGSKDKGGKYENQLVGTSSFVPEFTKAMAELPVNTISDPVESQFGYHVMKVDSRTTQTVEQEKESIKNTLSQTLINDFVEKEFPTYEYKSNLPQPSPAPESTQPAVPEASPSASPEASPAASPTK